jgi:hypothetical protein
MFSSAVALPPPKLASEARLRSRRLSSAAPLPSPMFSSAAPLPPPMIGAASAISAPSDSYSVGENVINMSQCQRLVQKALNRNNFS